jgi:hypothetical protein
MFPQYNTPPQELPLTLLDSQDVSWTTIIIFLKNNDGLVEGRKPWNHKVSILSMHR